MLAGSKLVADRFEAGRWSAMNLSATSFEPDSVMEYGFYSNHSTFAKAQHGLSISSILLA